MQVMWPLTTIISNNMYKTYSKYIVVRMYVCTIRPVQSQLAKSLEGELTAVKSELVTVRHNHSREKNTLSEQLEEMKKMATLTEARTKSEKVKRSSPFLVNSHFYIIIQMRLQTELNRQVASLKEQLGTVELTMDTMSSEKQLTENQLVSKSEELEASEERAVSLSNECAAVQESLGQLQEELRETTQLMESKKTLAQEKKKVWSTNRLA